jgi:hypothetical protein
MFHNVEKEIVVEEVWKDQCADILQTRMTLNLLVCLLSKTAIKIEKTQLRKQ